MKKALTILIGLLFASVTFAQYSAQDEYAEYFNYYSQVMSSSNKYLFSSSSEAQQAVSNLQAMKKHYDAKYSYFIQKSNNSSNIEEAQYYMQIANECQNKSKYCHNWIIKAKTQVDLLRYAGY